MEKIKLRLNKKNNHWFVPVVELPGWPWSLRVPVDWKEDGRDRRCGLAKRDSGRYRPT